MSDFPYLSIIVFLPAVGALLLMALRAPAGAQSKAAYNFVRMIAMLFTTATMVVTLMALTRFDPASADYQLVERQQWASWLTYYFGVDGISMALVVLTAVL